MGWVEPAALEGVGGGTVRLGVWVGLAWVGLAWVGLARVALAWVGLVCVQ